MKNDCTFCDDKGMVRDTLTDDVVDCPECDNPNITEQDADEFAQQVCFDCNSPSGTSPVTFTAKQLAKTLREFGENDARQRTRETRQMGGLGHAQAQAIKAKIAAGEAGQYEAATLWQELERLGPRPHPEQVGPPKVSGEEAWAEEALGCKTKAQMVTLLRAFTANMKAHRTLAQPSASPAGEQK